MTWEHQFTYCVVCNAVTTKKYAIRHDGLCKACVKKEERNEKGFTATNN